MIIMSFDVRDYDFDADDKISMMELMQSISDLAAKKITLEQTNAVKRAWEIGYIPEPEPEPEPEIEYNPSPFSSVQPDPDPVYGPITEPESVHNQYMYLLGAALAEYLLLRR